MSYLSKIRIGVTEKGLSFLKNYVKGRIGEEDYRKSYMNNYKVFEARNNISFIGWDWIDFSEKKKDVKAIYEALSIMEENEISYRMVIVGEDYAKFGAIQILDKDPFNIIPYIYTTIEFVYGDI